MSAILNSDDLALLPSNSTALERELAALTARLDEIDPSVISKIWNAWECPTALLPWLAWAVSVDFWDDAWSEITKRQSIADSPAYHRIKGTRRAVETMLHLLGKPFTLTEWWEITPNRRRGTASVLIELNNANEAAAVLRKARPYVAVSKPKSRAVQIGAGFSIPGNLFVGVALASARTIVIEPFKLDINKVDGPIFGAVGVFIERTITIEATP